MSNNILLAFHAVRNRIFDSWDKTELKCTLDYQNLRLYAKNGNTGGENWKEERIGKIEVL